MMPTKSDEIKADGAPLSPQEIRAKLMLAGVEYADIAARVKKRTRRECPIENVSRVVNRTPGFAFPAIRQVISEIIKEPVERIGREASRPRRKGRGARSLAL